MRVQTFLFLFIFLSSVGCSDNSEYFPGRQGSFVVKSEDLEITKVKVIKWRVGPLRRQVVSKGFIIKFDVPVLSKSNLKKMTKNSSIDSWLLTIMKKSDRGTSTIGRSYIPIKMAGIRKGSDERYNRLKQAIVKIKYAAASISSRFEKFMCPAFDHRFIIDSPEVEERGSREYNFSSSPIDNHRIVGKIEPMGLGGFEINGGKSLEGEYYIEVALYSSKDKTRRSNFVRYNEIVKIANQNVVRLKGCASFKIPIREDLRDGVNDFKFGK
jgi:hypothetical protein